MSLIVADKWSNLCDNDTLLHICGAMMDFVRLSICVGWLVPKSHALAQVMFLQLVSMIEAFGIRNKLSFPDQP